MGAHEKASAVSSDGPLSRHRRQLIPMRQVATGEFPLPHLPALCDSLDSKQQRIAPIDTIDGINNRHQAALAIVLGEGDLSEEVGLHYWQ